MGTLRKVRFEEITTERQAERYIGETLEELEDPVRVFSTVYAGDGIIDVLELLGRYPDLDERRGKEYQFRIEEISKRHMVKPVA